MVVQGKLVLSIVSSGEDDTLLLDQADESLTDLLDAGKVTQEEIRKMTAAVHFRSQAEIRESVDAVSDLFTLEDSKFVDVFHPLYAKFAAGGVSKEEYATGVTNNLRAALEPAVVAGLDASRPGLPCFLSVFSFLFRFLFNRHCLLLSAAAAAEKQAITEALFVGFKKRSLEHPAPFKSRLTYLHLTRK